MSELRALYPIILKIACFRINVLTKYLIFKKILIFQIFQQIIVEVNVTITVDFQSENSNNMMMRSLVEPSNDNIKLARAIHCIVNHSYLAKNYVSHYLRICYQAL